jgi:hypothetical protein
VSRFRLHPIVAAADDRPRLKPSDVEVARVLEVPLEALMAPGAIGRIVVTRDGESFEAPSFLVEGLHVWGATARVLAELITILGWTGEPGV